jgi:nitrite reductase/ring-hydroxylating ferredoxin subunit
VTQEPQTDSLATRRGVLAGVGLVGLAGAITACGGGSGSSQPGGAGTTQAAGSSPAAAASSASAAGSSASGAAAGALATTSQIPVGSGMIFTSQQVVVTQPSSGEFKAFSAVCTHMGCIVNQISDGTIDCPCHGSQYSIKTGDVVSGPAPKPLPAKQIKVTGDSIFLQ